MIKGISIMQPWASLIALGLKDYETRSWQRKYRGELVVHASLSCTEESLALTRELQALGVLPMNLPVGVVLSVHDLREFYAVEEIRDQVSPFERRVGDYRDGRYAAHLRNRRQLPHPIPWRGALDLWPVPQLLLDLIGGQGVF